jgi:hypothetical protein
MMIRMVRRLHREEEGYSLVIAILLLAIMMVLLVVALDAGNASLRQSSLSLEWSKALTVAEAGLDASITRLGESRTASNPCSISTSTVCSGGGGQYQVSWTQSGGKIIVTSIGYYPTKTSPKYTREVQATYEPVPSFKYAIFSETALDIKNGSTITGDIYSDGDVTVGQNATICGSILSSAGGVSIANGGQILTSNASYGCSGKSGRVWTGGSTGIVGTQQVVIQGDAIAGAPSTTSCSSTSSSYAVTISGGGTYTVNGAAKACGQISGVTGATSSTPGVTTTAPAPVTFPNFVFDPNNYPASTSTDPLKLQCYPSAGTCGSNQSSTAVADFNTYLATHKTSLTGTFAVWQSSAQPMSNPGNCTTASTTQICLDGIKLSGDFTLITNAPVDFGNTSTVTGTSSSIAADMVVVSTYQPASGTSCTTNGGDCSIYGQNSVQFDGGSASDPDDGIVGLLYTTGKIAWKNHPASQPPGEGALYAGSMDLKNGYDILYNARIERVLGFGVTYERTLWQELNL